MADEDDVGPGDDDDISPGEREQSPDKRPRRGSPEANGKRRSKKRAQPMEVQRPPTKRIKLNIKRKNGAVYRFEYEHRGQRRTERRSSLSALGDWLRNMGIIDGLDI